MNTKREFWQRNVVAVVGMLVFSAGINLFIVPANLYNGGVLGISQVIRTVLVRYFHLASGTTDIAGIINMLLNIPLFVLAYVFVGKKFFFRTLVCVVSQTLFLSLIPIPAIPPRKGTSLTKHNWWNFWRNRNWDSIAIRWIKRWFGYCWYDFYQTV